MGFTDDEKRRLLELGAIAQDHNDDRVQAEECDCGALWITKGQELFDPFLHPHNDPDFGGPAVNFKHCGRTGTRFLVLDGNAVKLDARV